MTKKWGQPSKPMNPITMQEIYNLFLSDNKERDSDEQVEVWPSGLRRRSKDLIPSA